jgi:hypothetical protein
MTLFVAEVSSERIRRYAWTWVGVMRSVGRFVVFTIVSSGTFTCLASAQPAEPMRSRELVDPWRSELADPEQPAPSELLDPWQRDPAGDPVIVDPWQARPHPAPKPLEIVELVDPWSEATARPVPTAAFPPVDPWQGR